MGQSCDGITQENDCDGVFLQSSAPVCPCLPVSGRVFPCLGDRLPCLRFNNLHLVFFPISHLYQPSLATSCSIYLFHPSNCYLTYLLPTFLTELPTNLLCIHPKSGKNGGDYLSAQKNWRKKCVNINDKILRQKGINHKHVMNLWQNSIFTYKIWYLCVFI